MRCALSARSFGRIDWSIDRVVAFKVFRVRFACNTCATQANKRASADVEMERSMYESAYQAAYEAGYEQSSIDREAKLEEIEVRSLLIF
jgi:hypothetical protein